MSCSDCAEYRAHGATVCGTCDAFLGSPGLESTQVGRIAKGEPCNCDQAIRNAKLAEVAQCALQALQGIRAVLESAVADGGSDAPQDLEKIATLVSLAEAGVERLNRS